MTALSVKDRIAQKRGEIAANKSKGVRSYRWKTGKTMFRILPDPETNSIAMKAFGKMWLKTFDEKQKFTIGDRQITFGETDPIREMIFESMKEAPTEDIKKHYQSMLATPKNLFQVLILSVNGAPDPDAPADQPQIVELSNAQFDNVLAQFEAYFENDETHDLASADRGHVFSCEKRGDGYDTSYTFLATPKAAPVSKDIVEKQHDLDAWIKSEFDGLQEKAIEFLGRLNGAAGISVASPSMQLTSDAPSSEGDSNTAGPETGSADTITDIVDAEYNEVDTSSEPTPDPVVEADTGSSDDEESIDDILAGLE